MELKLEVLVDPKVKGIVEGSVSYETGLERSQAGDPTLYAYEHHGRNFTAVDPGALTSFYEDLALGRPMPLKFATPSIRGIDTLVAITLFLHRDLATHPAVPGFVFQTDLVHRWGLPMFAHVEPDLGRFFRLLGSMFPEGQSRHEEGERLKVAVGWILEFLTNGSFPHLGPEMASPQILHVGTNGFVFAESRGDLHSSWVEVYRQGFTRGVVLSPGVEGRRKVLASRKSVYVPFNLTKAAETLNEFELAQGDPPEWRATELWLNSPDEGTLIPPSDMMEVFLRV